jgi:hypothetical protein
MEKVRKADPSIYTQMRRHAFEVRLPKLGRDAVHIVLMDWLIDKGTATVVAAADGAASVYLSVGGGFIGGSEKFPAIRQAALHAVKVATGLQLHFDRAQATPLPSLGDVNFYVTTNDSVRMAVAPEAKLRTGTDPLSSLGAAMQKIITGYRLNSPKIPARSPE